MRRILVIEDDPIMRDTLRDILIFEGYEVEVAIDGLDALRMLGLAPYDLVLTDVLMPGCDGFEIIQHCRQQTGGVKVIAISGGGYISPEAYLRMASDAGAHAVIGKPFDMEHLTATVSDLMGP